MKRIGSLSHEAVLEDPNNDVTARARSVMPQKG
jgi:hypothetical protein